MAYRMAQFRWPRVTFKDIRLLQLQAFSNAISLKSCAKVDMISTDIQTLSNSRASCLLCQMKHFSYVDEIKYTSIFTDSRTYLFRAAMAKVTPSSLTVYRQLIPEGYSVLGARQVLDVHQVRRCATPIVNKSYRSYDRGRTISIVAMQLRHTLVNIYFYLFI